MAQFFIDPAADGNAILADFTVRFGATNLSVVDDGGTPALRADQLWNGGTGTTVSYDPAGQPTDFEIVALHRSPGTANNDRAGIAGRVSGAQQYAVVLGSETSTRFIYKDAANARSLLFAPDTAWANSVYSWTRLQVIGDSIKIKRWLDGTAEPTAWLGSLTDIRLSGIFGYVGLAGRTTTESFYAKIGIGTNGDPAPTAAVTGGGFVDAAGAISATMVTTGSVASWPPEPSWRDQYNRASPDLASPYNSTGATPAISSNRLVYDGTLTTDPAVIAYIDLPGVGVDTATATEWAIAIDVFIDSGGPTCDSRIVLQTIGGASYAQILAGRDQISFEIFVDGVGGYGDSVSPNVIPSGGERMEVRMTSAGTTFIYAGVQVGSTALTFTPGEAVLQLSRNTGTGNRWVDNLYIWADAMTHTGIVDYSPSAATYVDVAADDNGVLTTTGVGELTKSAAASTAGTLTPSALPAVSKDAAAIATAALTTQGTVTGTQTAQGAAAGSLITQGAAEKTVSLSGSAGAAMTTQGAAKKDVQAAGAATGALVTTGNAFAETATDASAAASSALAAVGSASADRESAGGITAALDPAALASVVRSGAGSGAGALAAAGQVTVDKSTSAGVASTLVALAAAESGLVIEVQGAATASTVAAGQAAKTTSVFANAYAAMLTAGRAAKDQTAAGSTAMQLVTAGDTFGGAAVAPGYLTAYEIAIFPAITCYTKVNPALSCQSTATPAMYGNGAVRPR